MPVDNPEAASVAISTAGGLVGSGVVTLSKPMSRREVCYTLLGGTGLSAFIPPMLVSYAGLPWFFAGGCGFVAGLSIIGLIPIIQAATNKIADTFIKNKTGGES
jgi:hypothetical protein